MKSNHESFITSQFSDFPLVRMFHSRKLNDMINAIHERALGIAYCDKHSTFQQWKKTIQFPRIIEICKYLPLKCLMYILYCILFVNNI